ncbi:hypothetical protein PHET_11251 [Paragonimus heterotremus]|uniref:Uncharacterized protein n=1 Tax=Paragonimus heterotremus TaxID=100268 RepID=A0A8J4SJH9_9TREM|nr:hypothetical protein PHET_11251 [Paragonimus heterotremus]
MQCMNYHRLNYMGKAIKIRHKTNSPEKVLSIFIRYCVDRIGLNVPFSVYTWASYTPICNMDLQYPWNLVKGGLRLTQNGENLVLPGPMTAQYIIVMMDRRNRRTRVKTLVTSEFEAFGRKIRDAYVPPTPRFGIWTGNTVGVSFRLTKIMQSNSYLVNNAECFE